MINKHINKCTTSLITTPETVVLDFIYFTKAMTYGYEEMNHKRSDIFVCISSKISYLTLLTL